MAPTRKLLLVVLVSAAQQVLAQGGLYDLPKGSQTYRKIGIHDGNLVRTTFLNTGQVALFDDPPAGEWPKGSGHNYIDGVAILIATKINDIHGIQRKTVETEYRERTDPEPRVGDKQWGCEPLPGFAADGQDSPAMSDKKSTWPQFWPKLRVGPDSGKSSEWDGHWNGYFGLDQMNADQESYFYYDDSNDDEFEYLPDLTDSTRRGMGILVKVRGLQWSQVLAEDVTFWLYEITNISSVTYDTVSFGMYVDSGVGGKSDQNDDKLNFDTFYDITYAYDNDGIGYGNFQPLAYVGYAFLESPGNNDDGIDNDQDGIIDERRDNPAGDYLTVYPYGIADPVAFQRFYGRPPAPHWSGDENGDWDPVKDDIGSDGVGPNDPQYVGPDADGTEGNGRPDQGEPHFGSTDPDESDQIGLTSAQFFPIGTVWPKDDDELFRRVSPGLFQTNETNPTNIGFIYGSGFFRLDKKETERFSMALLFGIDRDDLFRNKLTVQQIYNANYQFAKAPLKPKVHAFAGDRRVTLYWDRGAEISFDPIYGYDFEGYAIYKSTEPSFASPETKSITDMFGVPTYRKPVAQFDIAEGIKGEDPIGVRGARFNRGTDSGLQYSWVDTNVVNGQTYYYAVVSYDRGYHVGLRDEVLPGAQYDTYRNSILPGLQPIAIAECPASISLDQSGNVVGYDANTVGMTPTAPPVGYQTAEYQVIHTQGPGTGRFVIRVLDPTVVAKNTYTLTFTDNSNAGGDSIFTRRTTSYTIYDQREHSESFRFIDTSYTVLSVRTLDLPTVRVRGESGIVVDTSKYILDVTNGRIRAKNLGEFDSASKFTITYKYYPIYRSPHIGFNEEGDAFDGMKLYLQNDSYDKVEGGTGWKAGSKTTWNVAVNPPTTTNRIDLPSDLEIRFADEVVDTSITGIGGARVPVNFTVWDLTRNEKMVFRFKDADGNGAVSSGDDIEPLVQTPVPGGALKNLTVWSVRVQSDTSANPRAPGAGDVIQIQTLKPFRDSDVFAITTTPQTIDVQRASNALADIYVVPNPYVATTTIEPSNNFRLGRGERRVEFVHLPPECTISIFTMSGYLVKSIHRSGPDNNGSEFWDLRTKDGLNAAYGYYIYVVDAPGIGKKTGKLALVK
jgi:hypothetical protein